MPKTLFIIPGFTHSVHQKEYKKVAAIFKRRGYTVIGFNPSWKRSTVSQQLDAFLSFLKRKKPLHEFSILGFSFGAVIALLAAQTIKPKELFLCSLSPYFSEDIKDIPPRWKKFIGKRRLADFQTMNCKTISKKISSKTHLFVEGKEYKDGKEGPTVLRRAKAVHKVIPESTLTIIPNTDHDIGRKEYIDAIQTML